jgi:hypothetical protein
LFSFWRQGLQRAGRGALQEISMRACQQVIIVAKINEWPGNSWRRK